MQGNDPLEGEEEQANFWATNNEIYKKKSTPILFSTSVFLMLMLQFMPL